MTVIVIEAPEAILTLDEARAMVPSLVSVDDDVVEMWISISQAEIEPTASWVGHSFGVQTLELQIARPCGDVRLPNPPIRELVSIKYLDADSVEQELDVEDFSVAGGQLITPKGWVWPEMACRPDALRISYEAGYEVDDPQLLPAKQAVILGVQQMRTAGRDGLVRDVVEGIGEKQWSSNVTAMAPITEARDRLLARYAAPHV